MKAALTIPPPPWMRDLNLLKVMNALNTTKETARLVGGCIRNHLMGEPIKDIDIATFLTPNMVIQCLEKIDIKVIPTGIKYGTITAVIDSQSFEITTCRADHNTDGRHADVVFGTSWIDDARRRDFTINAIYASCDGHIYDPLGVGIGDIQNHIVRFIGDPQTRIKEDYLRILRFFRFNARYNRGAPHEDSLNACKELRDGIQTLSDERIADELYKILAQPTAPRALNEMREIGLFPLKKSNIDALSHLISLQNQLNLSDINMRYLQTGIDKKYIKNNKINKFNHKTIEFKKGWDGNLKLALYRYPRDVVIQGLLSLKAEGNPIHDITIGDAINLAPPILPVTAQDMMDHFKIPEGKVVGDYLQRAETIWIASNFQMKTLEILENL